MFDVQCSASRKNSFIREVSLSTNHQEPKGFSLLEILIVLLIVGIVSTQALPTIQSGLEISKISEAAGEIMVAIEYAQLSAMTTGAEARVTIDPDADTILLQRYRISGDILSGATEITENDIDNGSFVNTAHPTNRGVDYAFGFADDDRFSGIDITAVDFGGNNVVTFDALGLPSSGGTITLTLGSSQRTLTVDGSTGKVTSSG